ncbi:hypothetical protein X474_16950 [Dethiosulfatarculus sandiegensis]|uniref:Uncharacterized protein n=1 Tax=Dethiosulfatarculus sandiegensis TaxID=1429043 RepID=A0A0D2HQR9_9BACT|nr:hypothetical protein X474_16950 [Dethiosulfatarculus sandiegensis]
MQPSEWSLESAGIWFDGLWDICLSLEKMVDHWEEVFLGSILLLMSIWFQAAMP